MARPVSRSATPTGRARIGICLPAVIPDAPARLGTPGRVGYVGIDGRDGRCISRPRMPRHIQWRLAIKRVSPCGRA